GARERLRRDDPQPDRAGDRGDRPHHGGLPHLLARHVGDHELVQRPRGAGGAVSPMSVAFVRTELEEARPAPRRATGALAWLQKNLFATPMDTVLTLLGVAFLIWSVPPLYNFFIGHAVPPGGTVEQCRVENVGACWAYIDARIT